MIRDLDKLVQAILDGVPGSRVKDRMAELEALLAEAIDEPALLHPNLARSCWQQVARLAEALNDEHHRTKAGEVIRGLIDRIELTPKEENGARMLTIELRGALAGILSLATNSERPLQDSGLSLRCAASRTVNRPLDWIPLSVPLRTVGGRCKKGSD